MMQSSSSRSCASERSPTRKNKSQSQREYRSKEIDGFTELRDALLLVDPFDAPLGRDATRHQLLVTAAKKLRNLADENQKLALQLSAVPTAGSQRQGIVPCEVTTLQGYDLFSDAAVLASQQYENNTAPRWSQSPPPQQNYGHQPYGMALGSTFLTPQMTDMWCSQ